jgi:hypothetical protein
VLLNFEFVRCRVFNGVSKTVQGTRTRIAGPRKHELLGASHSDELVVNDVRRHANEREFATPLADDLVTRRERNQVSKPLQRDSVAIMDLVSNGLVK